MTSTNQTLQQQAAVISGVSLLIMTIAAIFAYGYVHSSLVLEGDAAITFQNIQASPSLFRLEILGWLIILVTDVLVAWGFYVFLKPYHQGYALVAGWLRLLYTAILGIAVSHLVVVSRLIQKNATGESLDQIAQQVMDSITAFEAIWSFGLILFGLHLLVVGLIAMGTKKIPKVVSILVLLAGFSYTLIHFMDIFFPQLEEMTGLVEGILLAPMFLGEIGFGLWLWVKGRKLPSDPT
ncbi:hypothetical protein Q75_14560 [Bacillus coahuilensis p1.1.43]|uniref:DUF4386 domain-containing protein n=1 Tax=Bacillus coahuilensis p1.1.43 TaxID=1150625 RepID=A0A147K535_9BACI|nr:DUF4386 domain-containing protein [Bacillus coahuilensis]KUP04678.1 hypothetical protein Q75_14560 [Bacillus coahuilensis p1.1.43]